MVVRLSMNHPKADEHHPLLDMAGREPSLAIVLEFQMIGLTLETDPVLEADPVLENGPGPDTAPPPAIDLVTEIDPGMTIVDGEVPLGVPLGKEIDSTLALIVLDDGEMIPGGGGGAIQEDETTPADAIVIIDDEVPLQIDRDVDLSPRLVIRMTALRYQITIPLHPVPLTNTDQHTLHDSDLASMIKALREIKRLAIANLHQIRVAPVDIVVPYQIAMKNEVDHGRGRRYLERGHQVIHGVPTNGAKKVVVNEVDGEARVLQLVLEVHLEFLR
jgi:hypothetical protein